MRAILTKTVAIIQLTRIALVLTAVSNIWLVVLWARIVEGRTTADHLLLWEHLGLAAGVAIGLYVFGMVGNDVFDARRDRVFAPHRPIPAKRIRAQSATALAMVALLLAILCAVGLGVTHTLFCLAAAGLIVFYNAAAKFMPGVGILTLGLIRAAHMLVGEPTILFCWPVWLVMTHVIVITALAHRLEHKRPYLSKPELWGLSAGWVFWSLAIIGWMAQRDGLTVYHKPWVWAGPIIAGLAFLGIIALLTRRPADERAAGRTLMRLGLTWLIIFDGSWFLSAGLWQASILFAALLLLTWIAVQAARALQRITEREMYRSDREA